MMMNGARGRRLREADAGAVRQGVDAMPPGVCQREDGAAIGAAIAASPASAMIATAMAPMPAGMVTNMATAPAVMATAMAPMPAGMATAMAPMPAGMATRMAAAMPGAERRYAAASPNAGGGDYGLLTVVASTGDVDRHGDVIAPEGWRLEAYRRNPVVLWAHDYRRPAIGRAAAVWREGDALLAQVEFAPTEFAGEVAALYRQGYQQGVSVGFRPIRFEERRDARSGAFLGIRFLEQELLEISAAPVPANGRALRRGAPAAPASVPASASDGILASDNRRRFLTTETPAFVFASAPTSAAAGVVAETEADVVAAAGLGRAACIIALLRELRA